MKVVKYGEQGEKIGFFHGFQTLVDKPIALIETQEGKIIYLSPMDFEFIPKPDNELLLGLITLCEDFLKFKNEKIFTETYQKLLKIKLKRKMIA